MDLEAQSRTVTPMTEYERFPADTVRTWLAVLRRRGWQVSALPDAMRPGPPDHPWFLCLGPGGQAAVAHESALLQVDPVLDELYRWWLDAEMRREWELGDLQHDLPGMRRALGDEDSEDPEDVDLKLEIAGAEARVVELQRASRTFFDVVVSRLPEREPATVHATEAGAYEALRSASSLAVVRSLRRIPATEVLREHGLLIQDLVAAGAVTAQDGYFAVTPIGEAAWLRRAAEVARDRQPKSWWSRLW